MIGIWSIIDRKVNSLNFFLTQRISEVVKDLQGISWSLLFHNLRNWEIKKIRAFNNVMQLNRCLTPDSYSGIVFINFYHNWNILSFFFPSEFIDISLHFFLFSPPSCMKELPGICIVIHSLNGIFMEHSIPDCEDWEIKHSHEKSMFCRDIIPF